MPDANSTNESEPRFAFFDLDHTIIPHDTQLLFCNYVLHHEGWRRLFQVPFFLCIPLAACRMLGARAMKRIFLGYLWGMKKDRLAELLQVEHFGTPTGAYYPDAGAIFFGGRAKRYGVFGVRVSRAGRVPSRKTPTSRGTRFVPRLRLWDG